jgi:subtilase family serine protease
MMSLNKSSITTFNEQSVECYADYFFQAAAQGHTVIVSSGGEGAQQSIGNNRLSTREVINHLCSSPYVVCVGGTTLNPPYLRRHKSQCPDVGGSVCPRESVWLSRGRRLGQSASAIPIVSRFDE